MGIAKTLFFTQNEAKNCPEAAENDGVPLELDLHPHDGERSAAHSCRNTMAAGHYKVG